MILPKKAIAGGLVVCMVLFAFAFVAAPKSCQWGNEAYFWAGVVALMVLLALPFALRVGASVLGRTGIALAFVVLGFGVWVAGFIASDMRIICSLI